MSTMCPPMTMRHCLRFIAGPGQRHHAGPETAHALAYAEKLAAEMTPDDIIVNLSGRGDKDILTVASIDGIEL